MARFHWVSICSGDNKDFQNDEKEEIERDSLSLSVTRSSSNLPSVGSVESSTIY